MLTPEQRYRQAIRKARIQSARDLRLYLEGKTPWLDCSADKERAALIGEIERAYRAGYADGLASNHRTAD